MTVEGKVKEKERENGNRNRKNSLSYFQNFGKESLKTVTLDQLIRDSGRKWMDKECFYDATGEETGTGTGTGRRLNFQEIDNMSDWFASGLIKMGLVPGDRVGIWSPNSVNLVISFFGIAKAGLISVCINSAYQAGELEYSLSKTGVKALIIAGTHKGQNFHDILTQVMSESELKCTKVPTLTTVILMEDEKYQRVAELNTLTLNQVMNKGRNDKDLSKLSQVSQEINCDQVACIQFTSGTTGKSKGVILTHKMLINSCWAFNQAFRTTENDKLCVPLPSFHAYGLFAGVLTPFLNGSSVVIPSPNFSPRSAMRQAAREKCTMIFGTPTMHTDMTNLPDFDQFDLKSLRLASTSGASASESLIDLMKIKYKIQNVIITLGTTETLAIASTPFSHDKRGIENDDPLTLTSLCPLDHTEVKIIDDKGALVPVGVMGELCVRSSSVMPAYWNDLEKTREVIDSENWFHTGDACVMNSSGHLAIVGRFKDVINRGGEKIHPKDVEDFLCTHPHVLEAHVFGVNDARLGEIVAAWILIKKNHHENLTAQDIQKFCRGQISQFKIPTHVKILKDSKEIPKSGTGKIPKNLIRSLYEKELGL